MAGDVVERLRAEALDMADTLRRAAPGLATTADEEMLQEAARILARLAELEAGPTDEVTAMKAVMENVDPATWPGLTIEQRCALGRFAKPAPGHTDLMVPPESIDSFLAANPLEAGHAGGGEPIGWQIQFHDGSWSMAIYPEAEFKNLRTANIKTTRKVYASPPATPAQPTASVEAIKGIILDAMGDLRADIYGDIDGKKQAADWAAANIASLTTAPTQGWQPIKTGPKGRRVLVKFQSGEVEVCYQTDHGEGLMDSWRYAFADRGRQAPWPVEWCEIPGATLSAPVSAPSPAGGEVVEIVAQNLARKIVTMSVRWLRDGESDREHEDYVLANWSREIAEAEKLILAALSNPAPGHGEAVPVAWTAAHEEAFRLAFEGYNTSADRFGDSHNWGMYLNKRITAVFGILQKMKREAGWPAHPATGEKPAPATGKE